MVIKKYFKCAASFIAHGNYCIVLIIFNFLYLSGTSMGKENNNLIVSISTKPVKNKINTLSILIENTANLLIPEKIRLSDSIPPKGFKKQIIKKHFTGLSNRKSYSISGRTKILVKNNNINKLLNSNNVLDSFYNMPAVYFNLPLKATEKKASSDTMAIHFFDFINKYYRLPLVDSFNTELYANSIKGRILLTNPKNNNQLQANEINGLNPIQPVRELAIDSFQIKFLSSGNTYSIDSQKLFLDPAHIIFRNFLIKDTRYNSIFLNGTISSLPLKPTVLNLNAVARNIPVLQVNKAINNQLYGFAAVDGVAEINGDFYDPLVTGNLELTNNTDITVVLPQINLNKQAEKELVYFIKKDIFLAPLKKYLKSSPIKNDTLNHKAQIDINLHLKSTAAINFIIDPATGDKLNLHGDALLKTKLDTAGSLLFYGLYKLDSGYYRLSNQYLQKQFKVLPGSTITFTGKPGNALVGIKAMYTINTDAFDLLKNEIGYTDKNMLQALKSSYPFKVLLNLSGSINNLKMGFNIMLDTSVLPKNNMVRTAIKNKLVQLMQNSAATNKQVFSLLLYERFVGEQSNDFFSISRAANEKKFDRQSYESVSSFLSSAIDNIAEELFKTLDVHHNLNNYKDFGDGDAQQKLMVNIDATKSFINDRISLNVGKNYGIDGEDASAKAAQQKGVGFLPDVTTTYKFSRDGNFRYRTYKKNPFEITVDGFVTESGISLLLNMDYDKFINIIKR